MKALGSLLLPLLAFTLGASAFLGYGARPAEANTGYELNPSVAEFSPSGSDIIRSFFIKSSASQPIAIELSVKKIEIAPDGTEKYVDADDDFLVYPPQIIVRPGQQQRVQVTWLGDADISEELAFNLISEQVPLNLQQQPSRPEPQDRININLNVLTIYMAAVYVTPANARPNVAIESVVYEQDNSGQDVLVVVFENSGNKRGYLNGLVLNLNDGNGKTVTLTADQLPNLNGALVLAGNKRRFVLPWPKELPVGPVTATFTTN
jgi:fimbrial chaperone protein